MQSITKTASRITELRATLGLSQKEFAERIGITQGALSQLENQKSALSLSTIVKISDEFNIDCNWLIMGDRDSLQKDSKTSANDSNTKTSSNNRKLPLRTDYALKNLIPLIKEEAHAGYVGKGDDDEYLHSLDAYKIPGFESGNYRMFEIEGNSMMPAIHPREIVVTEKCDDYECIENGTLVILVLSESIVAKRVYCYKEEPEKLILKSDNADYKTYSISKDEAREIWCIKAKITNTVAPASDTNQERLNSLESDIIELKQKLSQIENA